MKNVNRTYVSAASSRFNVAPSLVVIPLLSLKTPAQLRKPTTHETTIRIKSNILVSCQTCDPMSEITMDGGAPTSIQH